MTTEKEIDEVLQNAKENSSDAFVPPLREVRTSVLGFGLTKVKVGMTHIICTQPQYVFKGQRLVIPEAIANNYIIHDVKIGTTSQLLNPGAIPASAFSSESLGYPALDMDAATPGVFISLIVERVIGARPNWFIRMLRKMLWLSNENYALEGQFTASLIGEIVDNE